MRSIAEWMRTSVIARTFGPNGVLTYLGQQLNLLSYAMQPQKDASDHKDCEFRTNEDVWKALTRNHSLKPNTVVSLRDFAVTEWLPRAPGLYHSPNAGSQRVAAESFRMSEKDFLKSGNRPGDKIGAALGENSGHIASVIYDPYGKSQMIEGGIGCVRLKDLALPRGQTWILGATASEAVHEGIPIAMSDDLYEKYISDVARGGFLADLRARARLIPDALDPLYQRTYHIPKVYFEIIDDLMNVRLNPATGEPRKGDWVTGAVGFRVKQDRHDELLATFTSFENGDPDSLEEAVEWLEKVYVEDKFKGSVVTDFDQHATRFKGAVFSIDNLFANAVDVKKARELVISVANPQVTEELIERISQTSARVEIDMSRTVRIGAKARLEEVAINLGDNAVVAVNSQIEEMSDRLGEAIKKDAEKLPKDKAKKLKQDHATLRRKLASKEPKKSSITKTLTSIATTAKAAGAAGLAILKAVTALTGAIG